MTRESLSVTLASALGAFIGTLAALELGFMWPIGVLVGAVVGYITNDFKAFCSGFVRALVKTYRGVVGWRPQVLYWQALFWGVLSGLSVSTSVSLFALLVVRLPAFSLAVFVVAAVFMGFVLCLWSILTFNEGEEYLRWLAGSNREIAIAVSPLGLLWHAFLGLLWLAVRLPQGARAFARGTTAALVFVRTFAVELFRLVHSERRLVCFVDAGLGASIGFFAGNALIGAVAGGLLGLVDYQVVSVWWLKIAPR